MPMTGPGYLSGRTHSRSARMKKSCSLADLWQILAASMMTLPQAAKAVGTLGDLALAAGCAGLAIERIRRFADARAGTTGLHFRRCPTPTSSTATTRAGACRHA